MDSLLPVNFFKSIYEDTFQVPTERRRRDKLIVSLAVGRCELKLQSAVTYTIAPLQREMHKTNGDGGTNSISHFYEV